MKEFVAFSVLVLWGCGGQEAALPEIEDSKATATREVEASSVVPKEQSPVTTPRITGSTPITSKNYQAVMEAQSREYEALEYKPVTLTGFTCGDKCYVEYQPHIEGGGDMTAICTAPICGEWERAGKLPALYANKKAGAKFGTAPQVDGSGKVMNPRYSAIVDLRLPG